MFDFGFWEIIMIMVIALIVVGPERLPSLARTAGFWVGKAKRFVADVKSEIDQEISSEQIKNVMAGLDPDHAAEKLKQTLNDQSAVEDVYEILEETKEVGREIEQAYNEPDAEQDDTSTPNAITDNSNDKS